MTQTTAAPRVVFALPGKILIKSDNDSFDAGSLSEVLTRSEPDLQTYIYNTLVHIGIPCGITCYFRILLV